MIFDVPCESDKSGIQHVFVALVEAGQVSVYDPWPNSKVQPISQQKWMIALFVVPLALQMGSERYGGVVIMAIDKDGAAL